MVRLEEVLDDPLEDEIILGEAAGTSPALVCMCMRMSGWMGMGVCGCEWVDGCGCVCEWVDGCGCACVCVCVCVCECVCEWVGGCGCSRCNLDLYSTYETTVFLPVSPAVFEYLERG